MDRIWWENHVIFISLPIPAEFNEKHGKDVLGDPATMKTKATEAAGVIVSTTYLAPFVL